MKRLLLPALFLAVSVCAPRAALAGEPVPKSYGGRQVYWRWSTEHTEDWYAIPYAQRWMVPEAVVRQVVFLRHHPLRVPAGNPAVQRAGLLKERLPSRPWPATASLALPDG